MTLNFLGQKCKFRALCKFKVAVFIKSDSLTTTNWS